MADERRELLAALSAMWAAKELASRTIDVLDGCPAAITPGLPRRTWTMPHPALSAWGDWLLLTLISSGLLVAAFLLLGMEI